MFFNSRPMNIPGDRSRGVPDEFRVRDIAEMLGLLRQIVEGSIPVHLNAPDGTSYTTTLWTLDTGRGKLSFAADADDVRIQRLLDSDETTVTAYLDSVKLQFDVHQMVLVHGSGSSALQTDVPREMFRFQRRSSYRVRPLARTAPVARMRHPGMPDMTLELRVLDLSIGGCALFLPNDVPPLQPGVQVNQVRIEIDSDTRFDAQLQLQHVTALNPESGGVRLGCEFVALSGAAERALQRFIDHTQKRRRMLSME